MQLDDLKQAWAAHGAILERSLAIDERLLREGLLRNVRIALAPYVLWRAVEVVLGVAMLSIVVSVVADHVGEPRYAVGGGALAVFIVGITALCACLLTKSFALDYGGPVTTIQREVARIKVMEYHALKWAVLGGLVAWLPAALISFEALTGVDALARVHLAYLVGNLVVGLAVLGVGHVMSRWYVEHPALGPAAHRLVDALSGRGLRSAAAHLAELGQFEREEPPTL